MEASQFGSPGAWGQLRADDKCGLFCRDSMISAEVKKMRQSFDTELQQTPTDSNIPRTKNDQNLGIWGFRGIHYCWPSPHLSLATPAFGTCSGPITQHTCACVRFFLVGNPSLNHMVTRLDFLGMLNLKLFTSAESHLYIPTCFWFCAMAPSYLYVLGMSRHHSRYTHGMAKTPNQKDIEWICRICRIYKS